MSKVVIDRAVVEQALYALGWDGSESSEQEKHKIRLALRAALKQPQVEQEPFAVLVRKNSWHYDAWEVGPRGNLDYGRAWADERVNVYTHPQPPHQQPQVTQEPPPNGATHKQPKQGAFYKRVDGKWYVWSRMKNDEPHRWYISPGTTESCLEPLYTHAQPRQPLTDEQIDGLLENVIGSLPVARKLIRAVEAAHGIGSEK